MCDCMLKVGFLLLVAAVGTHAQSFHLRNCPKPSLQVNFNITKVKYSTNTILIFQSCDMLLLSI